MKEHTHIYNVIIEELEKISNIKVEFGFIENVNFSNFLSLEGKFILMGSDLASEQIGISTRKEYSRTVKLHYLKSNNITTNSLKDLINIENILKELAQNEKILHRVYDLEYSFNISLIKESEENLTGVLDIAIEINFKER